MSRELWRRLKTARPFFLISGPNVLQGRDHALRIADCLAGIRDTHKLEVVFKASFDKANRTSLGSYRGPGLEEGLRILEDVRSLTGLPLISDIHEPSQAAPAAEVLDILQIPAFLCRQSDLLTAAAKTGRILHIKKGQFASAQVMLEAAAKAKASGNDMVLLGERGSFFGYADLVVDPRNIIWMQEGGAPVVMDVTHCLQQPSARREERPDGSARVVSGGDGGRVALVPAMGSMALALGARGVFIEAFPHPPPRAGAPRGTDARAARLLAAARALTRGVARQQIDEDPLSAPCDGPLQWPAHELAPVIRQWARVAAALEHRSAQHT